MMKQILALCVMAFILVACDDSNKTVTSNDNVRYKEVCIDGVVYLERHAGYKGFFSVKFNPDSTVVTCEK